VTELTPGVTKLEILRRLRLEDAKRDLNFHYGLITVAPSLNRMPNEDRWLAGAALSIDSGTEKEGYVADLTRMAILGSPSAELRERLDDVTSVQNAFMQNLRAGVIGGVVFGAAMLALAACQHAPELKFTAHGIGLNQHEAPRFMSSPPDTGPGTYWNRPLLAGMVVSVETTMRSSTAGFIKIEDTVAITKTGFELFGGLGRDWNVVEVASGSM
jgi:Xaa-Pro aminopeptidase